MLNNVVLMGRLTADPELRTTSSNVSFVRFSIAVERNFQSPGQERQTDFINCVAWRQSADFISRYFRKGQMIAIQGSIQTGSYEDKNGVRRNTVDIVVDRAHFCGSKAESGVSSQNSQQTASYQNNSAEDFNQINEAEDDLPF